MRRLSIVMLLALTVACSQQRTVEPPQTVVSTTTQTVPVTTTTINSQVATAGKKASEAWHKHMTALIDSVNKQNAQLKKNTAELKAILADFRKRREEAQKQCADFKASLDSAIFDPELKKILWEAFCGDIKPSP